MSNVLGILGHLYSGSTLMELVLNSNPDIMSIGESYHFIEKYYNKNFFCGICSPKECSIFGKYPVSLDLIHRAPFNKEKISLVVDSTKTFEVWRDLYIPNSTADNYIFISMIKEPNRAMYSFLKKINNGYSKDLSKGNVPKNIYNHYKKNYSYLDDFSKKFKICVVSYEEFCVNPINVLKKISNFLNNNGVPKIDYTKFNTEDWSYFSNPTHRFAGNWNTVNSPRSISLDDSFLEQKKLWDKNINNYVNLMKIEHNKILKKYKL